MVDSGSKPHIHILIGIEILIIVFSVGLAVTLNALGKVNHELGYYTESVVSMQRGREILKHLYPANHPQVHFNTYIDA